MNILDEIAAYKLSEIDAAKAAKPLNGLVRDAREAAPPRGFRAALQAASRSARPGLIAEIKKASPSKGLIRRDFHPESAARAYERAGAVCLSVLTDGPSFQGSSEHLIAARAAVHLPVLRKDFMLDPYQVVQSRAIGADCILVILAMLNDQAASSIISAAREWGMDVLVEVHDETETRRAVDLGAEMIGINNRDLKTFVTSLDTAVRLKPLIPPDRLVIAESGLSTPADLRQLAKAGIAAYLVGEALMRFDDLEAATGALIADWHP
ncbi:MAG TPA: indole-3-glycerol phosphate synthase TrpC [Micropepsaceae bacterium]|nr:indole-3-glycerol phosphate synthase TrpC [Micropepsaceae bacterium]